MKSNCICFLAWAAIALAACEHPGTQHATTADSAIRVGATDSTRPTTQPTNQALLTSVAAGLREVKPEASSIKVLNLQASGFSSGYYGIVLLRGKGFGTDPTTASGEVYAIIRIDSSLTRMESLVDTFPTGRGGDYDVWFQPGGDAYPLVVCGQGVSYGDQRIRRAIYLDSAGMRPDSITVEHDIGRVRWMSERGCGIRGTSSDESF